MSIVNIYRADVTREENDRLVIVSCYFRLEQNTICMKGPGGSMS